MTCPDMCCHSGHIAALIEHGRRDDVIECRRNEAEAPVRRKKTQGGNIEVLLGRICWIIDKAADYTTDDTRWRLVIMFVADDAGVAS